jgi:UDP-glucose 4-epimerase
LSATWIVGQGGLLGSAIARRRGNRRLFHAGPIPWGAPDSIDVLRAALDGFLADVSPGTAWTIVWAAGAGVIESSPADLEREATVVQDFLSILAERREAPDGCFFLTSSASVYAGSSCPPFDEGTEPVPLNAYGRAKRAQEQSAFRILDGRVSRPPQPEDERPDEGDRGDRQDDRAEAAEDGVAA